MHFREIHERSIGGDSQASRCCPRDGQVLQTGVVRGVEIDRCLACEGVFLDHLEFEALTGAEVTQKLIDTMPYVPHSYAVYPCPCCRGDLIPRFCARGRHRYEIYFCGECHGMWLDVGTLRRLRFPAMVAGTFEELGGHSEHMVVDKVHRADDSTVGSPFEIAEEPSRPEGDGTPGDTTSLRVGFPKNPKEFFVAITGFPIDVGNPCTIFPLFTWLLVLANLVIFALPLLTGIDVNEIVIAYGLRPDAVRYDGEWYRLVTSMFLHGGWIHLIGNIAFFYVFGDNLEERYGSMRFVAFYLVCGVLAGGASCLSAYAQGNDTIRIGASGAISAVLGAYLITFPRTRILVGSLFFRFVPVVLRGPAWMFVVFWVGFNLIGYWVQRSLEVAMVDYVAHLAGFAVGFLGGVALRALRESQDAEASRVIKP